MKIEVASSKNQKRQRQQKVNIVSKVPVERVKSEIGREGIMQAKEYCTLLRV